MRGERRVNSRFLLPRERHERERERVQGRAVNHICRYIMIMHDYAGQNYS